MQSDGYALSGKQAEKQQYPLVDIVKFICALLVVTIHISPVSTYCTQSDFVPFLEYGIRNYAARIAVPFYFSVAGFFLFRKIDLEKFDISVTKNYIFKLLRLLGIWTVLLFIGRNIHLWYMSAIIVAVCLLSVLLLKKIDLKKILVIALVLYFIGLIGNPYFGLIRPLLEYKITGYPIKAYYEIFTTTRNGVFMGFPFLLLGGFIEKKKFNIKPVYSALGFILSMGLLFCEAFFVRKWNLPKNFDVDLYLFLLPAVFFLLVFSVNVTIKPREIYKKLRAVGVIIFFSHFWVYQWIEWFFSFFCKISGISINNSLVNYSLTILAAAALGFIIEGLSHKKKTAFLKYLYS